jgi:hypothetical protein
MQYRNTDSNKPESKFDINKIILKSITKILNKLPLISLLSQPIDASKIMKKILLDRFESEIKSESERCSNLAQNGKIVIALDLLGTVNGKIYLTGFPQLMTKQKNIF